VRSTARGGRIAPYSSSHDKTAVDRDGLTSHVAGSVAAEPQNRVRNLLGAADPSHRHALLHCLESIALTGRDHLVGHRCPNKPRAYGIDTDAAYCVFESRALGEPKHPVLGGVIDWALGAPRESPERRAIDDRATSLFSHLLQFELHAAPFAAKSEPKKPQELVEHNCINLRLPTHGGLLYAWEFEKGSREIKVRVEGQLFFNTTTQMLHAALAGLGLTYLPEGLVQPYINKGRFRRILEDWCPPYPGYHLYYPSRRQPSAAFALLVDALRHRD
jgi:hypothetical protein